MPIKEEKMLNKQAKKKGLKGKSLNSYVYGTLVSRFGYKPKKGGDK